MSTSIELYVAVTTDSALRAELHGRAWERVIVATLATVLGEDGKTPHHQEAAPS